jgi:ABC-type glutathione transport system ATPase component
VFGLDFAAVAEIHARIVAARNRGAAVLLVSEDLDELLQLSDRIVVMSEGVFVHECDAAQRHDIGRAMGGGMDGARWRPAPCHPPAQRGRSPPQGGRMTHGMKTRRAPSTTASARATPRWS